jgi:hypothetical protein
LIKIVGKMISDNFWLIKIVGKMIRDIVEMLIKIECNKKFFDISAKVGSSQNKVLKNWFNGENQVKNSKNWI